MTWLAFLFWAALAALLAAVAALLFHAATEEADRKQPDSSYSPHLRRSYDGGRPKSAPKNSGTSSGPSRRESMPEMRALAVGRGSAQLAASSGGRRGTWAAGWAPPGSASLASRARADDAIIAPAGPSRGYRQYVNTLNAVLAAQSEWATDHAPGASAPISLGAELARILAEPGTGREQDPSSQAACGGGGDGPREPRLARLSGSSSAADSSVVARSSADFRAFTQVRAKGGGREAVARGRPCTTWASCCSPR